MFNEFPAVLIHIKGKIALKDIISFKIKWEFILKHTNIADVWKSSSINNWYWEE